MIGLSVKTHYAIIAMLDLAEFATTTPIQLRIIVKKHNLPHNYLEQAMIPLKQANLVTSTRGSQGGYRLGKPATDISILDIIQAIEGNISFNNNQNNASQSTQFFWSKIDKSLQKILDISLNTVLEDRRAQNEALTYMI